VLRQINAKMIYRHPHVWGDVSVQGAGDVLSNWDALKKQEQAAQGIERKWLLDGVPKGLPALMQAAEYQRKAAKPGFDWEKIEDVVAKVREELDEVLSAPGEAERAEEIGDLFFALVNWARWLGIEPETALRETNAKFYRRFRYIEEQLAAQGRALSDSNLAEMDALWDEAKSRGL
jgi:tetrapyrrole methylase family protein/MazG family protein